jgi:hypothetical protein
VVEHFLLKIRNLSAQRCWAQVHISRQCRAITDCGTTFAAFCLGGHPPRSVEHIL